MLSILIASIRRRLMVCHLDICKMGPLRIRVVRQQSIRSLYESTACDQACPFHLIRIHYARRALPLGSDCWTTGARICRSRCSRIPYRRKVFGALNIPQLLSHPGESTPLDYLSYKYTGQLLSLHLPSGAKTSSLIRFPHCVGSRTALTSSYFNFILDLCLA